MENIYNRHRIADGVYFTSITDKKFKIDRVSVIFVTELSDDAALKAVIPRLLTKCNENINTLAKLNRRLAELYSANIVWTARADSDYHVCELSASVLDNRFALDGEDILKETVRILLDCIFKPYLENGLFPAQSLETEKQNQADDNDAEINDKTQYAHMKGYEEAFKGEPAAIRWGGTNDQVESISPESAIKAYKKLISEARAEVICVGESDFSGLDGLFAEAFGNIERKPSALPSPLLSRNKDEVSRITEILDVEQSKLVMFFKTSDRYRNKDALRVMQCLYGGTESSKLFSIVREQMSLCYYCYARMGFSKGYISAELGTDRKNLDAAEKECLHQLQEIADGNFTDTEVEKVKLYIINMLRSTRDTVSGITSECFARIVYPDFSDSVEESIRKINAVTREDIIEAARSLKLDTVYILTSEKEADAQ